jgi:hypothetical protein
MGRKRPKHFDALKHPLAIVYKFKLAELAKICSGNWDETLPKN